MTPAELTALLELERALEQRFATALSEERRNAEGTLDAPSAKDVFGHAVGARQRMHEALVASRAGQEPDASHDRADIFYAGASQSFESLELQASRVAEALTADVDALDTAALARSPSWIEDATLGDEIIQQCVTHALVLMSDVMCELGQAEDAHAAQSAFVRALPPDASALQRSRALYNLACLELRTGREDDAVAELVDAVALRPSLAEQVRDDPELAPVRDRVLR